MKMMARRVAVSTDYITPHHPLEKTCHGRPCFDWLTVKGHWVRLRALLLIKPAINISITICTYFRDDQTDLEKGHFPIAKKMLFFSLLKIFQKLSQITSVLSIGIGK